MGLRINTNVSAVMALRNLHRTDKAQTKSLERLSTGLRINRASDDPSGLVISEILRSQIGSLNQAIENTKFASNLIGTADAALTEVSSLLTSIRGSAIFALNTGGTSPDQIAAEQDAVDAALASIDRVSATTRFGSTNLLNGSSALDVSSKSTEITEIEFRSISFNNQSQVTFEVDVTSEAERARVNFQLDGGSATGSQVIRITGTLGTQEILITSGTTTQNVIEMVNAVRGNTGIFAVLSSGTEGTPAATDTVAFMSEEYGSVERSTIEVISGDDIKVSSGTAALTDLDAGGKVAAFGEDIGANINGAYLSTKGNKITVNSAFLNADITVADGTAVTAANSPLLLTVADSGLDFQLNIEPVASDLITLGLSNVATNFLGTPIRTLGSGSATQTVGGYLNSLVSGGANDLVTNPGNAVYILDAAIDDINALRGFLGAFASQTLESNINSLGIAVENLTASESEIRDLDFAEEVAEFTRSQILFSAGTSVLASANLIPQSILTLLQ